jgi:hypothetical protein
MEVLAGLEEQLRVSVHESALAQSETIDELADILLSELGSAVEDLPKQRPLALGDYDFAHSPEYLRLKENA